MRTPTAIFHTLACTLACILAACGDGGGPVDSGLPPEKTVMELTTDEADKLCRANVEHLASQNTAAELKEWSCVLAGQMFAMKASNTPAECEQFAQLCRDGAGEEAGNEEGGGDTCSLGFELTTCTATIADVEACMTEKNEAFGDGIRAASCDDVGKEPVTPVTGPSCTKVKSTCPGIA
jgi:hypothetical protein